MGRIDTFNRLSKLSFQKPLPIGAKIGLLTDICWERLRYGTEMQDYYQYEFYNLKNRERRKYMTFQSCDIRCVYVTIPKSETFLMIKLFLIRNLENICTGIGWMLRQHLLINFQKFVDKHPVFFTKARSVCLANMLEDMIQAPT